MFKKLKAKFSNWLNSEDPCGPQGNHWFVKLVAKLCPSKMFGVSYAQRCVIHDDEWSKDGANKSADKNFMWGIVEDFKEADKPLWQAFIAAYVGYIGVRIGGIFYKLGGK